MSTKHERQRQIVALIGKGDIASQPQLQAALKKSGIVATQATISRDLEELGAVKVRVRGGESVYAIPEFEAQRVAPSDQLRRVMSEWVAEISASGTMVVVRTPPGCAHVVASALDRSAMPSLLGTVAGDDTVLCVAAPSAGGQKLAKQLRDLAGLNAKKAVRRA